MTWMTNGCADVRKDIARQNVQRETLDEINRDLDATSVNRAINEVHYIIHETVNLNVITTIVLRCFARRFKNSTTHDG